MFAKFKFVSLIAFFSFSIIGTATSAADFKREEYFKSPTFEWLGYYVGGGIGYQQNSSTVSGTGISSVTAEKGNAALSILGGYNFGASPMGDGELIYGGELGLSYGAIDGSATSGTTTSTQDGNFNVELRGRLGYAWDNYHLFTALGYTYTNFTTETVNGGIRVTHKPGSLWSLGLGGEYAFTPKWIGRLEYKYDGFGEDSANGFTAKASMNTFRAAVLYKF